VDITPGLVLMLNALSAGVSGGTDSLLQTPEQYNKALYDASILIHNTAVKPITAIVLAIIFMLMLASNSTRIEADRELGVRIISGTLLKVVLVFLVAQNATIILNAIAAVSTIISKAANNLDVGTGANGQQLLGDTMKADIQSGGIWMQLGLFIVLLLPFLVSSLGTVVVIVLVFVRFLQMYLMSAFASLPIAFFGHEDTKQIAIGYLKRFAVAAFTGTVMLITVKFYQALLGGWLGGHAGYKGDPWGFILGNYGSFFIAPAVLVVLVIGANGLAKAIVGEG